MERNLKIRVETLMLGLDYLRFLASIENCVGSEAGPLGWTLDRPLYDVIVPENPHGFSTDAARIDGVMQDRCGCPAGIKEYDWAEYYEQSVWKPFAEGFLDPNRRATALLRAPVEIAGLLDASKADIERPNRPSDAFEEEAGIFSRFLALLASGEITEADLKA